MAFLDLPLLKISKEGEGMNDLKTVNLSQILEVWESWNGWYWFVKQWCRDACGTPECNLAFGLVRGFETEWGNFDPAELQRISDETHKVWRVPKRNWALCPCVIDDVISYSQGMRRPKRTPSRAGVGKPCPKGTPETNAGVLPVPTTERRDIKHGKSRG